MRCCPDTDIDPILLTELSQSVHLGRVRSVLTTSIMILPYRPPAQLIRVKSGLATLERKPSRIRGVFLSLYLTPFLFRSPERLFRHRYRPRMSKKCQMFVYSGHALSYT